MKTVPLSEVKAHLSELADEVDRTHERVAITKNGRDYVVLMSAEDLAEVEATLELLGDPEAQERIRAAEHEVAHGEALSPQDSAALLESLRRDGRR